MTRIGRVRLLVIAGIVAALAIGALVVWAPWKAEPLTLTARFDNTVGIYRGSDVRVLGVKVGRVTQVAPRGTYVEVALSVDPDVAVARDTRVVVVAPTMVADRYVQLSTVDGGPRLADGAMIPVERTDTPVEIDRLYQSLDEVAKVLGPEGANKDGALSELIGVAADNLEGNGDRTRDLITDLGAAARTFSEADEDAFDAIEHLDQLAKVMQENDGHVRGVADRVARVTHTLAEDRRTIEAALRELSTALSQVETFVHDNRSQIAHSVDELADATQVLAEQRAALGALLGVLPNAVVGMLGAYDASRNVLVGRANPLDVTKGKGPDLGGVTNHEAPKLPLPMPGGQP